MSLAHPDSLRAEAERLREQAKQLRATATGLDRRALALDIVAARNQKLLTERGRR